MLHLAGSTFILHVQHGHLTSEATSLLVVMATIEGYRIGGDDGPLRKKPKLSELPLSSAKRSTIDGLLHGFKKKGEFDGLRKRIYAQFEQGVCLSSADHQATLT